MTFQFLKREDVDKIVELFNENFPDGWNKNMLLSAFDGGRFFSIGCFDNEKLIGAITCSLSIDDADIERIKKLYGVKTVTIDVTYKDLGINSENINEVYESLKLEVLEKTPPELSADIMDVFTPKPSTLRETFYDL